MENSGELFGKAQSATPRKQGQPIITVAFAEVEGECLAGRMSLPRSGTTSFTWTNSRCGADFLYIAPSLVKGLKVPSALMVPKKGRGWVEMCIPTDSGAN